MVSQLPMLFALALLAGLTGCSTAPKLARNPLPSPLFFAQNQRLEPVKTTEEDTRVWLFRDQTIQPNAYQGVILEPVYLTPDAAKAVDNQLLSQTQTTLDSVLRKLVNQDGRLSVVQKSGRGIARVTFAITGAEISPDPLQPWNFLPIGLVLSGITYSTGINPKTPALLVEAKFTDSETEALLGQAVIIVQGDSFRTVAGSTEAFAAMTDKVVRVVREQTVTE